MRNIWTDLNAQGIFLPYFQGYWKLLDLWPRKKSILPWYVDISKMNTVFLSNAFPNWAKGRHHLYRMVGGSPSSQGLTLKVWTQTLAFLTGLAEGAYQGHSIAASEMKTQVHNRSGCLSCWLLTAEDWKPDFSEVLSHTEGQKWAGAESLQCCKESHFLFK